MAIADDLVDLSLGIRPVMDRKGKTVSQRLNSTQKPCHSSGLYEITVVASALTQAQEKLSSSCSLRFLPSQQHLVSDFIYVFLSLCFATHNVLLQFSSNKEKYMLIFNDHSCN